MRKRIGIDSRKASWEAVSLVDLFGKKKLEDRVLELEAAKADAGAREGGARAHSGEARGEDS